MHRVHVCSKYLYQSRYLPRIFEYMRKTQTSAFESRIFIRFFKKKRGQFATWDYDEFSSFKFSILL